VGASLFAFAMMVGVALDGLISDWTLNPIHDILFAKIEGPAFTTAHAFSIVFVVFCGAVMAVKTRSVVKGAAVTFGTAAIHELMLVPYAALFQQDPGIRIFQPGFFFFDYGAYLLIALGLSLFFFPTLRPTFFLVFLFSVCYYAVTFTGAYGLHLPWFQPTINSGTGPTAYFSSWPNNLQEVFGWGVMSGVWLLPTKWRDRWEAMLVGHGIMLARRP
jgi:hypothetical protein